MTGMASALGAVTIEDPAAATGVIEAALEAARATGADAAEATLQAALGLSVTVRLDTIETVEHDRGQALAITVYRGRRKGTASTNDLRPGAIRDAVEAAVRQARFTEEDPFAGLVAPEFIARQLPELDLYHPWDLGPDAAAAIARECEAAARSHDRRITNSEGATVATRTGLTACGNSHGFMAAWRSTRHALTCRVVAGDEAGMQRDAWFDCARDAGALTTAAQIGRTAAERAVRRLGAQRLRTTRAPVLFEARVATSLFAHLVGAITGSAQYRQSSFLLDALGRQVCAAHLDVREEPHLPRAMGSAPCDSDGVATRARTIVRDGVLDSYLLSGYSARKLALAPTGHADGVHNLVVGHGGRDLAALLRAMGRGLLVTELLGFGVDITTGDYSRGAAGFWVEDGAIAYPVEEITIAGNLRRMLRDLVEVGGEIDTRSNIRTGPVLLDELTIAGR